MLDVPNHPLQPLSIDTNITYALDMSKFPGLDDPQHMYQPALLIATDWSDYVYHDAQLVTHDANSSHESDSLLENDLYSLIESSQEFLTDVDTSNIIDDQTFLSLLDDVVADSDVITPIDINPGTSNTITEPLEDTWDCLGDEVLFHTDETEQHICEFVPKEQLSPFAPYIRGQKRRRNDESINVSANKKSKIGNRSPLHIPTMVTVCSRSNGCELQRQS